MGNTKIENIRINTLTRAIVKIAFRHGYDRASDMTFVSHFLCNAADYDNLFLGQYPTIAWENACRIIGERITLNDAKKMFTTKNVRTEYLAQEMSDFGCPSEWVTEVINS